MKAKGLLTMVCLALLGYSSIAQESEKRFGFELSGGPSFATRNLNDANLKTGLGFEGILHYRISSNTGLYAGWGWNKFAAEKSFAGTERDFEETGYVIGLQYKHLIGDSRINYFLRAGALYNHIEIENKKGEVIMNSGHGFGWQVAGGIDLPLSSSWSITPGFKFNALSREAELEGVKYQMDLNYITARIGILKKF